MKVMPAIVVGVLTAQPLIAHASAAQPAAAAARRAALSADEAAVRSALSQYKAAIERLDARGTEQLFTPDSMIFETGGSEGNYANYLAKHLGPELAKFRSFKFSDQTTSVRFEGKTAIAIESYKYRIETEKGEIAERVGVSTSVLRKAGGKWKVVVMHSSARTPRPAS